MDIRLILKDPRNIFKAVCHRMPERSYIFSNQPLLVCARCMAIYIGFFITSIILFLLYGWFSASAILFLIFLFIVPIAVDGLTQLFKLRESSNTLRFITGYLAGMGVSFLFYAGYGITFFPEKAAVKLPTMQSFISLVPMLILLFVLNRNNQKQSKTLHNFFNGLITISVAFIVCAAAFLWVYMLWNAMVIYR